MCQNALKGARVSKEKKTNVGEIMPYQKFKMVADAYKQADAARKPKQVVTASYTVYVNVGRALRLPAKSYNEWWRMIAHPRLKQ